MTQLGFQYEARQRFSEGALRKIRSTNSLELLNGEIKRRSDVVGILPDEASIYRLVGVLLLE